MRNVKYIKFDTMGYEYGMNMTQKMSIRICMLLLYSYTDVILKYFNNIKFSSLLKRDVAY